MMTSIFKKTLPLLAVFAMGTPPLPLNVVSATTVSEIQKPAPVKEKRYYVEHWVESKEKTPRAYKKHNGRYYISVGYDIKKGKIGVPTTESRNTYRRKLDYEYGYDEKLKEVDYGQYSQAEVVNITFYGNEFINQVDIFYYNP